MDGIGGGEVKREVVIWVEARQLFDSVLKLTSSTWTSRGLESKICLRTLVVVVVMTALRDTAHNRNKVMMSRGVGSSGRRPLSVDPTNEDNLAKSK